LVACLLYQKFFLSGKANTLEKLHWISNLLLQNKTVRRAAGAAPIGVAKSRQTAWSALCAAHASVGHSKKSTILVNLYDSARTHFIQNS